MDSSSPDTHNYWNLMEAAAAALAASDFPGAEKCFTDACALRDASPARVFLTEKLGDGLRKVVRHLGQQRSQDRDAQAALGRWTLRTQEFTVQFLAKGEQAVREGLRLTELRPEDEAEANQPLLAGALFLVSGSRLFPQEPRSAVPLLKGLFRCASRTAVPFDVHLVRHDLPLSEEDRLWLAGKGGELLDAFLELGHLKPDEPAAEEWARAILQLLQQRYFTTAGRMQEERTWLEAVTADRLLGQAPARVELYRRYLALNPLPGPRADEARVRLIEILGNIGRLGFAVPRYQEALTVMRDCGLARGSHLAARFESALATIEYRRPAVGQGGPGGPAWASVAAEPDGTVAVIFWWDAEPRDVAYWRPGEDATHLVAFLEPCGGRILCADSAVAACLQRVLQDEPSPWSATDYAGALLEPMVPAHGLDQAALLGLGLGEAGRWRAGWVTRLGHPHLEPPANAALGEAWRRRQAAGGILAGLVILAVRTRLESADPSLRAGIAQMARRGDPACTHLYALVTLGQAAQTALDASFQPWTLPLLWTRPDPFGPQSLAAEALIPDAYARESRVQDSFTQDASLRPDLGRSDLAIVATDNPAAVMAAWGAGQVKWRVVMDRPSRISCLGAAATRPTGPIVVIPPDGKVHVLDDALRMLEDLLDPAARSQPAPGSPNAGLLALFHWVRLVETHNGDLLDFLEFRPRINCNVDIYEEYQSLIAGLPREAVGQPAAGLRESWAAQFVQRARKAGLVAGLVPQIVQAGPDLDACWGVFEGSDASWVFLDSAAIHNRLAADPRCDLQRLHRYLHSRGSRHLSCLTAAAWLLQPLQQFLAACLAVYGKATCLALGDVRAQRLKLPDQGIRPDAVVLLPAALGSQLGSVLSLGPQAAVTVLLPASGPVREFWQDVRTGALGPVGAGWKYWDRGSEHPDHPDHPDQPLSWSVSAPQGVLVVPVLPGLDPERWASPAGLDPDGWAQADQDKQRILAGQIQRSALELAGLLAGDWAEVLVLDVRWWHMLRGGLPALDGTLTAPAPGDGQWSARRALALTGAQGAQLWDLPAGVGSAGSDKRAAAAGRALGAAVQRWTAAHQPAAGVSAGGGADAAVLPDSRPGRTVDLVLGAGDAAWQQAARAVAEARDKGSVQDWVLVAAAGPPDGARLLIDRDMHTGCSTWPGCGRAFVPASVVWVPQAAFTDRLFLEEIDRCPPRIVVVPDLQTWLPEPGDEKHQAAAALRRILDGPAGRTLLSAPALPASMVAFLQQLLKDRLQVHAPASSATRPASPAAGEDAGGPGPAGRSEASVPPVTGEPATGPAPSCAARARRLQGLVTRLRPTLTLLRPLAGTAVPLPGPAAGAAAASGRNPGPWPAPGELVELAWLGRLAGLSPSEIALGIRVLRWSAVVEGDPLVASAGAGQDDPQGSALGGHALLFLYRYAEIESALAGLADHLQGLIPRWLQGLDPGMRTWIDLEQPPAAIDPAHLRQVDLLLGAWGDQGPAGIGLVYVCPAGALHSSLRLLGWLGEPAAVLADLGARLRLFQARIREVLDGAQETPAGLLVRTDLHSLRDEERDFLALGSALGFWRWLGPACPGAIALADLLTLADSQTARPSPRCWHLVQALLAEQDPGASATEDGAVPTAQGRPAAAGLRGLRSRVAFPVHAGDDLDGPIAAVADLAGQRRPGQLVLQGLAGTGRHEALVRGLLTARQAYPDPAQVIVFCPDTAVGAMISREFLRLGWDRPLDLVIPDQKGQVSQGPGPGQSLADPAGTLVVMCEVQRFAADLRYKIAQQGRGRSLLMTLDPAEATEDWEHLFLTSPRPEQVLDLRTQRRQAKRLWAEVRQLTGDGARSRGTSRHPQKGKVAATYAANLDQCLGLLAPAAGPQPESRFLRLTASLATDLEYLGGYLADHGWLAVAEADLDGLLLPGPREFLAAVSDLVRTAGALPADGQAGKGGPEGTAAAATHPDLLLPHLLPGPWGAGWEPWCRRHAPQLGRATLAEAAARLLAGPWLQAQLAYAPARGRCAPWLRRWGGQSVRDLAASPLWQVWLQVMREDLALTPAPEDRSVALLASSARRPAGWARSAAYLCLGSESPAHHYPHLSRVEQEVMILYQERSPLAQDADRPG